MHTVYAPSLAVTLHDLALAYPGAAFVALVAGVAVFAHIAQRFI